MNQHNKKLQKIAKIYSKKYLQNNSTVLGVFLIGSVARQQAQIGSDIDLLIITDKKLAKDQQDNMKKDEYKGESISLIFSNIEKMRENIKEGIMVDLCFSLEAQPIFDPNNLIKKIKKLSKNLKLDINLKSRIENSKNALSDAKRFFKNHKKEEAKIIILTESFFLVRGYVQSFNSPYTSAKHLMLELKKYDPYFFEIFKTIWQKNTTHSIIKEFEKQISYLESKL